MTIFGSHTVIKASSWSRSGKLEWTAQGQPHQNSTCGPYFGPYVPETDWFCAKISWHLGLDQKFRQKGRGKKKHTRKILIVCFLFPLFDPHSSSSTAVTLTVSSIKMRISDYTQWLTFTAIKAVTDKTSAVAVTDMLINGLLWHVNGSPPPNVDVVRGTIKDKVRSMRTNDIKMCGEKSK